MGELEIRHYVTVLGRDPFGEWLAKLRDRRATAIVLLRIGRVQRGLFGDCRSLGAGVWELRIDVGPGYRVYFGRAGQKIVLLLCGGDKGHQHEDIALARKYWSDYTAQPRT